MCGGGVSWGTGREFIQCLTPEEAHSLMLVVPGASIQGQGGSGMGRRPRKTSCKRWHLSWDLKVWEHLDSRSLRGGHPGHSRISKGI